jgi:enamine deaminase RidA (YjgF/YER057c/UK114 family)
VQTVKTGGRYEQVASYARVKRVGPFVYVAGTAAIEPTGKLHAPGDAYAQAIFIFHQIETAITEVGAAMRHIARTRAFLADWSAAAGYLRAHGEVFSGIDPVATAVQAGLSTPGMMIEIEADAVIYDERGS